VGPGVPLNVTTVSRYSGASATPEVTVTKTLRSSSSTPALFWGKPVQVVAPNGVSADYRYQEGSWDAVNGIFSPNGGGYSGIDIAEFST